MKWISTPRLTRASTMPKATERCGTRELLSLPWIYLTRSEIELFEGLKVERYQHLSNPRPYDRGIETHRLGQTPSPKLIEENETAEVRTEDGQGVDAHSQNGSVPALDEAGDVQGGHDDAKQSRDSGEASHFIQYRPARIDRINHRHEADMKKVSAKDFGHGHIVAP